MCCISIVYIYFLYLLSLLLIYCFNISLLINLSKMKLKVELSGGLEIIFKNKEINLEVENNGKDFTIQDLVSQLKSNIVERPDFFLTTTDEM